MTFRISDWFISKVFEYIRRKVSNSRIKYFIQNTENYTSYSNSIITMFLNDILFSTRLTLCFSHIILCSSIEHSHISQMYVHSQEMKMKNKSFAGSFKANSRNDSLEDFPCQVKWKGEVRILDMTANCYY